MPLCDGGMIIRPLWIGVCSFRKLYAQRPKHRMPLKKGESRIWAESKISTTLRWDHDAGEFQVKVCISISLLLINAPAMIKIR